MRIGDMTEEREAMKPKKPKLRHADITRRDHNLFRCLASGPKTLPQLRDSLAKKACQDKADNAVSNHDLQTATLKSRIHKLRHAGYLNSARYRTRSGKAFALYALTPASAAILAKTGYAAGQIRMAFPHVNTVSHEMLVVQVVERYRQEAKEIRKDGQTLKIGIAFRDENALKSWSQGGKKGLRYPDLLTTLVLEFEDKRRIEEHLAVEIDNNTMSPDRVFAKVKGMFERTNYATAMLCPNAARLNELRNWFKKEIERLSKSAKSYEERKKLSSLFNNVAFGIHDDFLYGGFCKTEWKMIDDRIVTLVPSEFAG